MGSVCNHVPRPSIPSFLLFCLATISTTRYMKMGSFFFSKTNLIISTEEQCGVCILIRPPKLRSVYQIVIAGISWTGRMGFSFSICLRPRLHHHDNNIINKTRATKSCWTNIEMPGMGWTTSPHRRQFFAFFMFSLRWRLTSNPACFSFSCRSIAHA